MSNKPYVIGVAGTSGAGKTFFLQCFLQHFRKQDISLISQDDYYLPVHTNTKEENKLYNFDLPTAIDREAFYRDISQLFNGNTVYKQAYTFNNADLAPQVLEINPAPLLIVEGLFIFHYEEVNGLFNQRIFIDADEPVALQRRIRRDLAERGYDEQDVRYKWTNHVQPAFRQFLLPHKAACDLIIENNNDDQEAIVTITHTISATLKKSLSF